MLNNVLLGMYLGIWSRDSGRDVTVFVGTDELSGDFAGETEEKIGNLLIIFG